jgi:hypothetical protein
MWLLRVSYLGDGHGENREIGDSMLEALGRGQHRERILGYYRCSQCKRIPKHLNRLPSLYTHTNRYQRSGTNMKAKAKTTMNDLGKP